MRNILNLGSAFALFFSCALFCACSTPSLQLSKNGQSSKQPVPGHSQGHSIEPLFNDVKVHRYTLENGLKLLVVEDPSSPTFAYQTWFKVGSRNEQVTKTGLAHLFEHMMFKQTKNLPEGEFDRTLEEAGAEGLNAYTTQDYTVYVQELPREHLELIIKLESDRMVNLVVNEQSFKTEVEVVQNERRYRTENSPDGTLFEEMFGLAYQSHPYRWPVIGYKQDLENMKYTDALDFYQRFYRPSSATIIVAGDVKPSEVFNLVKKYYGSLGNAPSTGTQTPEVDPSTLLETPPESPRRKILKLSVQNEKVIMAYPAPSIKHEDIPALSMLAAILSAGKSSRLQKAMVDSGIAQNAYASEPDNTDAGLFIFGATLQKGKKAAQAEAILLKEIDRLKREPVSDREFKKAKNLFQFGFYEGLNSNSEKCRFIGNFETQGDHFAFGIKRFNETLSVTPAKVQEVAQKYFAPQKRTVLFAIPK